MSTIKTTLHVDPAADPIELGGGDSHVSLNIGDRNQVTLVVGHWRGPEGVAWLRRLAVAAEELAAEVERHHGITTTADTAAFGVTALDPGAWATFDKIREAASTAGGYTCPNCHASWPVGATGVAAEVWRHESGKCAGVPS